jgi:hypothetical protein
MSFTPATIKTIQPPDCPQLYVRAGKSPAQLQVKHTCPTRPDPLSGIWPQAETILTAAPELEVKTDHGGNLGAEFKRVQQLLAAKKNLAPGGPAQALGPGKASSRKGQGQRQRNPE